MSGTPVIRLGWLIHQIRLLLNEPASEQDGVGQTPRLTDNDIIDIIKYQLTAMPRENPSGFDDFYATADPSDQDGWMAAVFSMSPPAGTPSVDPGARDNDAYPVVPVPLDAVSDLIKRVLQTLGLRDAQNAIQRHAILLGRAGHGFLQVASGETAKR